jgi:adenosylcobinamide-phosphate synthase
MTLALVLLGALLLDAVLGEPPGLWSRLPHPAVLMGRLVDRLDHHLNRGARRRFRGMICLFCLVAVALLIGILLAWIGPIAEGVAAAILLAQRSLCDHVSAVASSLQRSVDDGRRAVSLIVSRDTEEMDESRVARAAIESAAENLSDGVIAPAVWFLLAGAPGLILYKMVNTADSMIGYRTPRHEAFGWAAARCDDVMNLIPARLTALLIALPARQFDLRDIAADARLHKSPNAGWPEAAMSRVLGIALAGPRAYHGAIQHFPWVNPEGRRALTADDIDASVAVLWRTWRMLFILCAIVGFVTA